MRNPYLLLSALLCASACGKKNTATEATAAPSSSTPAPSETALTAEMPDTPEARAFAKLLIKTEVTGLEPTGGDDVVFEYTSLTFSADGRWKAEGYVEASFEKMECMEVGTWTIDEATRNDTATMNWTVSKTNCAMRENGTTQRVQMTIPKSGPPKIMFR